MQVNATALLPGQITCYYDEVSGIVTSVAAPTTPMVDDTPTVAALDVVAVGGLLMFAASRRARRS